MLLMLSVAVPLLVRVTVWVELELPTRTFGKVRLEGVNVTFAAAPVPLRTMECGEPAASSTMTMDPVRDPDALGVNVTENVHSPAAGTLLPQVSVSAKSPVTLVEEIDNAALPRLRRRTVCKRLVEPTGKMPNCVELGLTETMEADAAPIFAMNPSRAPPGAVWKDPCVVGKSTEVVDPAK
jgi:hypothetical protein